MGHGWISKARNNKLLRIYFCGLWALVVTNSYFPVNTSSGDQSLSRLLHFMATAAAQTNGSVIYSDWPGRYFHVDQVLDRPGPRTDPSFLAGDGVSPCLLGLGNVLKLLR